MSTALEEKLVLWNQAAGAQAPAAVTTSGRYGLHNFLNGVLRGNVQVDQPGVLTIVQQSVAGTGGLTWTVPLDPTLGGVNYPFVIPILLPFVTITWTQGAVAATFLRVYASVEQNELGSDLGSGSGPSVEGMLTFVQSDKDTNFAGAVAVNDQATANLTGLLSNSGWIESVTILSVQPIDWEVGFWSGSGFNNADMDLDTFLGSVQLTAATAELIANATGTTYRYTLNGLLIPYVDASPGTKQLHLSLVVRGGLAKLAAALGAVVVKVGVRS